MIRIDEIYNHTFWPWVRDNRPGIRVQHCDPFWRSDPGSVIGYGREDIHEHNYIFFFDQEPIHLNIHQPTFSKVFKENDDITHKDGRMFPATKTAGYLCTSERDSENVEYVCDKYHWKPLYYFFHGWAALDWFRGYNRSYLMPEPVHRSITKTFIAPNRIVAGARQHRLLMLYHMFKNNLQSNWISCPETCPAENISVCQAAGQLKHIYPDIEQIFARTDFPKCFPGESDSPMHSYRLSLFDQSAESLLYVVTETVADGRRQHLTEKIFKPICLNMPFVVVGAAGSLDYLRRYGFKTFNHIWDESYDDELDDVQRIEKIGLLLKDLDQLSVREKQQIFKHASAVSQHNFDHFYSGGFENLLWTELTHMLEGMGV
jgi:hypothetical protein